MPRCLADCVAMAHLVVRSEAQGDTRCGLRLVCRIMLSHPVGGRDTDHARTLCRGFLRVLFAPTDYGLRP